MLESSDSFLIILSVFIPIISSYIALMMTEKIAEFTHIKKIIRIFCGAVAIGAGIFSMHIVGMLAFHHSSAILYKPVLLFGAMAISIFSVFAAFSILFYGKLNKAKVSASGAIIGIGIILGHYTAMAAVIGVLEVVFNSLHIIFSLAIAIVFSVFAIKIFSGLKTSSIPLGRKISSSVILGLAVSLMHYTSMDAFVFVHDPQADTASGILDNGLNLFVFAMILGMVFIAIAFAIVDYRTLHADRHLQEKIKESESRFRRLAELSPQSIVVHSGKELVFVNEACLKMVDVADKSEVLGKSILDFVAPDFQDIVKERIRHMAKGTAAEPMEQQFIKPNGDIIDVEVAGTQMEFDGKPAIQLVLRNITEEKKVRRELEESEQRHLSLFTNNPDGVYSMDSQGRMTNVNEALEQLLRYTQEEFAAMTFHSLVAPAYIDKAIHSFEESLKGIPQNYEIEGIHKNGEIIPFHLTNMPIIVDEKIIGVYGIAKNITNEKQAFKMLEENEEKYRSLFEHNLDAVFETGLDGNFINVNSKAEELTGYSKAELHTASYHLLAAENPEKVKKEFSAAMHGESLQAEQRLKRKNGDLIEIDANVVPIRKQGEVAGVFSIVRDVTEKKQIQKNIKELAFTDQLTGLPNRHWFYEKLDTVIKRTGKKKSSIAILIIDFDDFKSVNDLLGHQGGDLYLQKVSERITACLRPSDQISRLGGDEFIMVLEDVTEDYVNRLARKILREMNQPIQMPDHELVVTISIGISMNCDYISDVETFIRQADIAMYSAKEKGKNNYQFFSQSLSDAVIRKSQIENALRKAVKQDDFQLYYQPQFCLLTEKLVGLEALIRWNSPFGSVSPAEFIPVAEETGLIVPIGEWVIKEACRQIKYWEQLGLPKVKVSVNVSARQFRDPQFSRKVRTVLEEQQVDPQFFEIEITESVMLNIEESSKLIVELKEMGIKVAIDDFGAGYSSLNVIKNVEIDTLKIDKSLIDDMIENPRNLSILKAIIEVGKSLHTEVVVEGIEEKEQVELLRSFDVIGQGYYFSRPCPPEQIEQLWKKTIE